MKRIIKVTAWVFSLLLFLIAQNSLSPLAKDYISGDLVYADSYDQVQDTGNDYIVLKDGRTLRCRIISIADDKVKVKLFDSQLIWEFGDEIQKRLIQQIKSNNEENIKRSQNAGEVSRKREYFGLAFLFMPQLKSPEFLPTSPNIYTELVFAANAHIGIRLIKMVDISGGINFGWTSLAGDQLCEFSHQINVGEMTDDPYLHSIDNLSFYSLFLKPRLNIISVNLTKSPNPDKLILNIFGNYQYYSMKGSVDEAPASSGWYSNDDLVTHSSKMTGSFFSYGVGTEVLISNKSSLFLDVSYGLCDNVVDNPGRVLDGRLVEPFRLVGDYLSFEFGFKFPINLLSK